MSARTLRPLACLLLLASTGAESWKGWLARGATDGFHNFVHATTEIDDARTSAHSLRIDGKVLSVKELEFALQGARLAFLAYADSQWEVEAGLRDARMELVCFAPQRAQARVGVPQWYLARSGDALYLVFRGTQSAFDMLHDLMAMPESEPAPGPWAELEAPPLLAPQMASLALGTEKLPMQRHCTILPPISTA